MNLNWTTIISSGITACIVGIFQYLALRYTGRIVDRIEKELRKNGKNTEKG